MFTYKIMKDYTMKEIDVKRFCFALDFTKHEWFAVLASPGRISKSAENKTPGNPRGYEPTSGIEPLTCSLRVSCSTS